MKERINKALEFIGSEVQTYGYFTSYDIPYENGNGIFIESDVTRDEFLRLTYEYFTDKNRINYDYGNDLKDQNQTKNFIRKRVNEQSLEIGKKYIENWKFKCA